jgi:DNA-binding CsgD family transcriptional regulator
VLVWQPQQLSGLAAALDAARSGQPAVLEIFGAAGTGKTALANELVSQATDFDVLVAEGSEDDSAPFSILDQWGVRTSGIAQTEPFIVAQELRRRIDDAGDRPLLLKLEDLHWADQESVDALVWVMRRSLADRLLVVATSRPLGHGHQESWQRWAESRRHQVARIDLSGLTFDQFVEYTAANSLAMSDATARALVEHTDGNPLYLRSLLTEYDVRDLTDRRVLPAPTTFVQAVTARSSRLPSEAQAILEAAAVLGYSWQPVRIVTAVAKVSDAAPALDSLVESGLIHLRSDADVPQVRLEHALVRSAVYSGLQPSRRKELHLSASRRVEDERAALDHRITAADGLDPELADDLEAFALRLRARRSWELSSYYLRAAASCTTEDEPWRRRIIEAAYDSGLIPSPAAMARELDRIAPADTPEEVMVRAFLAIRRGDREGGAHTLLGVLRRPDASDQVRYRASVLAAWALLESGAAPAMVDEVLQVADDSPWRDPALEFHHRSTRAFTDQEVLTPLQQWTTIDPELGPPQSTALSRSWELAQRAIAAVRVGLFDVARDDLAELMRRGQEGEFAGWDARVPAGLGLTQWLVGDWTGARVSMNVAYEASGHDLYLPLVLLADGRLDEAAELLDDLTSRNRLTGTGGWDSMLQFERVMLAHARGDRPARLALGAELAPRMREILFGAQQEDTATTLITGGIVGFWATDLDLMKACAARLEAAEPALAWGRAVAHWFRGLAAEHEGDRTRLRMHLEMAAADTRMNLPMFRANILLDLAECYGVDGDYDRAAETLAMARQIHASIGAVAYLNRIAGGWPPEAHRPTREAPVIKITERERDVLALLLNGMSYAQIGRDLFITQKTVGYHLSNLYAKANVSNRHELAALAREDPALFELDAATSAA